MKRQIGWALLFCATLPGISAASPEVIGQWPATPQGVVTELTLQGNTLYAKLTYGIAVLDVSDPAHMRRIATLGDYSSSVHVAGPYLQEDGFTPFGLGTTRLLDTQKPSDPAVVYSRTDYAQLLPSGATVWPYVYRWREQPDVLNVYDFTNPSAPAERGSFESAVSFPGDAEGNVLAAFEWQGPLRFWDITIRTHPVKRGSYPAPYAPSKIQIVGTYAFVTDNNKLSILNISNLDSPTRVGGWDTGYRPAGLAVANGLALVGVQNTGVLVLDISNPANPVLLSQIPGLAPEAIANDGSTWFVGDYRTLSAYDLTDPAHPRKLGEYQTGLFSTRSRVSGHLAFSFFATVQVDILNVQQPDRPTKVGEIKNIAAFDVDGNFFYALTPEVSFQIYEVSDPSNPVRISEIPYPGNIYGLPTMKTIGNHVFIGGGNLLGVVNISNKSQPSITTTLPAPGFINAMQTSGNYLFASVAGPEGGLVVVNIANPSNPSIIKTVPGVVSVYEMAISGSALYLPTLEGLSMFDISNPANPISRGVHQIILQHGNPAWVQLGDDGKLYASGSSYTPALNGVILVINISNPFDPVIENQITNLTYQVAAPQVRNGIGYVPAGESGLVTIRVAGPGPERPSLEIHPEGEAHRLRWIKRFSEYSLYSSPTLEGHWTHEILGYSPTGLFNEAARPNRPEPRFYRLQKAN